MLLVPKLAVLAVPIPQRISSKQTMAKIKHVYGSLLRMKAQEVNTASLRQ